MGVRGTENYIYYTDRRLGSGATGMVYFGRHKKRGDECAVKIYSRCRGHSSGQSITNNELEWMRRLRHKNVVSLLSIETDLKTRDVALVLEYCSHGSLDRLLKQPANLNGLLEEQFLNFLFQFCDGLNYLRIHGITHRDLKPSNILCTKTEYGSIWYKISDFGATKELFSEDQAMFGTWEYLHPETFKCILIERRKVPLELEVRSELWSIGITLYEVATGKLPFIVPGGRRNIPKMYELISQKNEGDISGLVKENSIQAEYTSCLPRTCWLSKSLGGFLTHILAGLIETDQEKQMSFDKFLPAVENLRSMKEFKVFDVSSLTICNVHFHQSSEFSEFKKEVSRVTGIEDNCQFYMVRRKRLEVGDNDFFYETRAEVRDEVIILLPLDTKFPTLKHIYIVNYESLMVGRMNSDDCMWALHASGWCSRVCTHINDLTRKQVLLSDLASKIINILETLSARITSLGETIKSADLKSSFKNVMQIATKFQKKLGAKSILIPFDPVCLSEKCSVKAKTISKNSNDTYLKFCEDQTRILNHNEEQIHRFKKSQLDEQLRELQNLFKNHCEKQIEMMHEKFKQWYISYPMKLLEIYQDLEESLHESLMLKNEYLLKTMEQRNILIENLEMTIQKRGIEIERISLAE